MRKILVRSGMTPFEALPYEELEQRIGGNVGNLIYAYGVYRMLFADGETELVSTNYRTDYSSEEIERINATFDCFVLPLADAIRPVYGEKQLPKLTKLVKALRIPCILLGMGLSAPYEPGRDFHFSYDGAVREFVAALLEKSAIVGLRGEITADYLSRLGFRPESDFTVIGCPSLYAFGERLALRDIDLSLGPEAKVSFCMSQRASEEQIGFIRENALALPGSVYIPQRSQELCLMRTGRPYLTDAPVSYPTRVTDEVYCREGVRFFNSAHSWIDFQRTRDLCFGTRVHGNISAVLAGTPALFLPFDARSRELVEYHHFAHIPPAEVRRGQSLRDWIERLDFSAPVRAHTANFQHYVDFLNRNGIRHIYGDPNGGGLFDERVASVDFLPPLRCITRAEPERIGAQLDQLWQQQPEVRRKRMKRELKRHLKRVIPRWMRGARRG